MIDEIHRNEVCDKYAELLQNNTKLQKKVKRLLTIYQKYGKLKLFCWCYPKRCHGDEIKKYLENLEKENK